MYFNDKGISFEKTNDKDGHTYIKPEHFRQWCDYDRNGKFSGMVERPPERLF